MPVSANLTAINHCMHVLTDNPVNWIMVIKGHKSKAPLLASITISHNVNDLDFAKLLEVISQVWLICIFLDAPNKDLFHGYMGTWPVWVLWQEDFVMAKNTPPFRQKKKKKSSLSYLSGDSTLRLYHSSINLMGTGRHGSINLIYWGVRHKTKSPGSFAVGVPHDL